MLYNGFNNDNILHIAMEQSAIDANCQTDDFLRKKNVVVSSGVNPKARKYLSLPHDCNLEPVHIKRASKTIASMITERKRISSLS